MCYHRLIFTLFFAAVLVSCKKGIVATTTKETYNEDLSVHRPSLVDTTYHLVTPLPIQSESQVVGNIEDTYSIREEMDSVNQIIAVRNAQKQFIDGYTIQVYTGNDADAANKAKEYVEAMYPELDPIVTYHQPSFKVKVGSYHNRLEAYKVFESLKQDFPLAILIPERIEVAYE